MTMTTDDHVWAIRMSALRKAGLLDDRAVQRLEEHLSGCDECREFLSAKSEAQVGLPPHEGHIPSDVLGRWDRSENELRGIGRALVRTHLERCESCREELEILGFEPVLEIVPELEVEGASSGTETK